ncbi:MAG TPA: twin-arginine translocase subunit TatC [Opitutaceae bacterium]|jgi:sec-independent protein translocase protein TatC|nr:twin-arginine translocase subunit TatC [Opitutaceae bacterium]
MSDDIIELEPEEDLGGKKSFWDHLDDLRKVLVRSAIAIGLALVVCLLLDSTLVGILEYPLRHMDIFDQPQPTVTFQLGSTQLGPYVVSRDQFAALPPGAAPHVVFQVNTAKIGEEQVVTLKTLPGVVGGGGLRVQLHNLSPTEAFMIAFQVALYGALVLSAPFWIFFVGQFILPALKLTERRMLYMWMGWGTLLFLMGVLSTYFFLLPVALRASIKYSSLLGFDATVWRADEYIGFVCKFLFGMGLGFQFPIIVLLLVRLGVLTHRQLARYRRHVVVLCLILGAVLTTPEVITQICMAVPLYLLYEICIWIAWYWDWKKRRSERLKTEN